MTKGGFELFKLLPARLEIALVALVIVVLIIRPWQTVSRRGIVSRGFDDFARDAARRVIDLHARVYAWIAGVHPARRPWHFQWLSVKDLYRDLRRILPTLRGNLLDVGCWGKPYSRWLTAFGSAAGLMLLNWITISLSRSGWSQLLMVALLPFWLTFCLMVNAIGWLLDKTDRTGVLYHNVLLVHRKRTL